MKEKYFQITKNNLLRILEKNSNQDLDLQENENLIFELKNFEMNENADSYIYCINFITTFGQRGFYKLLTDKRKNFKDEFFLII